MTEATYTKHELHAACFHAYMQGFQDARREACNLWNSAKDPPKRPCKVIVRCVCNSSGERDITTAYYRRHFNMTGIRSHWRVTHWMLPNPPEDEEEKDEN